MNRFKYSLDITKLSVLYTEWLAGKRPTNAEHMRFGQWLWNEYVRYDCAFPALYYAESASDAYSIAVNELYLDLLENDNGTHS